MPAPVLMPPRHTITPISLLVAFLTLMAFGTLLPIDYDRTIAALGVGLLLFARHPASTTRTDLIDSTLLCALGMTGLVSALLSRHIAVSLVAWSNWMFIWSIGIVAARQIRSASAMERIFAAIAIGGVLGTLYVWIARSFTAPGTPLPLYIHPRLMGMHLTAATVAALAWLHLAPRKGDLRTAQWLVAIVSCAGMLWSGGRSPILALGAALGMLLLLDPGRDRRALLRQTILVGIAALALSAANWTDNPGLGWWHAISRSTAATDMSQLTSSRTDIWKLVWSRIQEAPLLGHGPGDYRFMRPRQDGHQPHNWILQWLLESGAVGLVLFTTITSRAVARALRMPRDEPTAPWRLAAATGLCACLAGGLFDGYFYHAQIYICAALFAGLCLGVPGPAPAPALHPRRQLWLGMLRRSALVVGCLLMLIHSFFVLRFSKWAPIPLPDSTTARLVRAFPSWNYGLERWLDSWGKDDPRIAIAWSDWACRHGTDADFFYLYGAVQCLRIQRPDLAAERLDAGLRWTHRKWWPYLRNLRHQLPAQPATGTTDADKPKLLNTNS